MKKVSFLFILAVVFSILAVGSVWAEDRNVPAFYSTIQAAIDAAGPGDTINVAAGTYDENVVIDMQIILQGAGSGVTTIDASGGNYGITILSGGASDTQRLIIRDLHVTGAVLSGIFVQDYTLNNNRDYITIENTCSDNNRAHGIRVDNLVVLNDFELKNSQLTNNDKNGFNTESNTIVSTLLISDSNLDSNKYGMYLEGTIDGVTILRSTFNNQNGGYGGYMTETGPLTNMLIEDCEFNNNVVGLMVWNVRDNSGITIRNTSFQDNGAYGVLIWGDTLADVLIEECTVQNNDGLEIGYYGIDFNAYSEGMTNVAVHCTNITGHDLGGGLKNRSVFATNIVDATNNWWGDAGGPDFGDGVVGYVKVVPWLEVEAPCPPPVVEVSIDIKPGSDPNSINLKSRGVVPVAVLTTEDFDASTVDPVTVVFAGADPVRWTMEDVDGDSDMDMLFHFNTQDLTLDENSTEATLTGTTWEETDIQGTDTVNIVPKG